MLVIIIKTVPNPPDRLDSLQTQLIKDHVLGKIGNQTFNIPEVAEDFIHKQLQCLDETKATGLDNIGPRILKLSYDIISKPLAKVFNTSINKCTFPEQFKTTRPQIGTLFAEPCPVVPGKVAEVSTNLP